MKIEVEFRLDDTNEWFAKITDLLGYVQNLGFNDIKIKPEGYGLMKYGVKWEPKSLTDEEHQKLLKE
jgi:hypothetical protein